MLWCLILTFTLYSLLLLPTLTFFSGGKAYDSVPDIVKSSYLDTYLGNLGYSSVECTQMPAAVQKISLSCPYGSIGKVLDYGVNTAVEDKYGCMSNDQNMPCKPNAEWVTEGSQAKGKEHSLFDFNGKSLYNNSEDATRCLTQDATLFVQYSCIQGVDEQISKYNEMALAVATACIIAFLFSISIRYMH